MLPEKRKEKKEVKKDITFFFLVVAGWNAIAGGMGCDGWKNEKARGFDEMKSGGQALTQEVMRWRQSENGGTIRERSKMV